MQKSTKHGIIVVIAVLGIAAGVFFYSKKAKKAAIEKQAGGMSKEDVVKEIIINPKGGITTNYNSAYSTLMSFGDDYLKAWYVAVKSGSATFKLNNQTYSTSGGKAVVSSTTPAVPAWF